MDEQIEKLINHAGGAGRYQIIILIIGFFVWFSLSLHVTSIPMLETVPEVIRPGNVTSEKLTYSMCDQKYDIVKKVGFSWVIEMELYCSEANVGLIGSFNYAGMAIGSFLFSIMNKFITHKNLIIIFTFIYAVVLFLTTVVNSFYFRLFCLLALGISNCLANMSTMTLVSESVSSKKRSLFAGIINVGYSCCPIVFTPLYVILGQWRFIFWLQNIIAITCAIMFLIAGEDSARMFFSKNKTEEAIDVLKRIADFNGRLKEFEKESNDKEFDGLLRNEQEGLEKDLTVEMKPKYGASALLKYPSVRWKFLIFTFMFMSTVFLTNAVVINTKSMEGNTYVIIVSLFCVEVVAGICCGILINIPCLGRKKSLIGFYLGITTGFILTLLFDSAVGRWLCQVLIRFCITGVYTTFYIYFMENYPTPLRSLGFGLNSTFGNIAGVVSPVIIEFINIYILYLIFAVLSGINIFLTFFLKETVGKPMIETIEELEVHDVDKEKLLPGRDSDVNNLDKGTENKKEKDDKKEPLIKDKEEKEEKKASEE
jgi:MFS family permease